MNTLPPDSSRPGEVDDPRSRPDFRPEHYPLANGHGAPPVGAMERNDRITLEFLAVYYDLNCDYAQLLEVRQRPPSPERVGAERTCLQTIEKGLIARDRLEDHYASLGVLTDPIAREGFTRDLKIHFGNVDAAGRRRRDYYTLTAYVPIPLPEGASLKHVPMKIEGPGFDGEY
ncbi:MAG: hypothetical protein JXQ71_10340 [Verrucomicrobia bacterium]|nr:hypothetical protein [Verrucomicrobiota bacterium]